MYSDSEKILCSAILYKDLPLVRTFKSNVLPVNVDKGIVFCGFRHTHCMYSMISVTGKRSVETEVGEYVQGFLTSKNRFVDRKEAWIIAEREGQIKHQSGGYGTLYSECLW
jgi:hypothetical protein